tara:strand:+ start:95 stop:475 length:381 start_codon:yes stop_codon:yes gene_type:complete
MPTIEQHRANQKEHYSKNKTYYNNARKRLVIKNKPIRTLVDNFKLIKGCSSCGYKDHAVALQFDHINPDTKLFGISQYLGSTRKLDIKLIFDEINKCNILCSNCHAVKTKKHNDYGRKITNDYIKN